MHAFAYRQALAVVREARGAPPGPGAEMQVWISCMTRQLRDRAEGPGTSDEIIQGVESSCTAEEAAARAFMVREVGAALANAEMARLEARIRERSLQFLARIRASHQPR